MMRAGSLMDSEFGIHLRRTQPFLDGIQAGRLADLLQRDIEDYGIINISRYSGIDQTTLREVTQERTLVNPFFAANLCERLAFNPKYIEKGVGPKYKNIK